MAMKTYSNVAINRSFDRNQIQSFSSRLAVAGEMAICFSQYLFYLQCMQIISATRLVYSSLVRENGRVKFY